jgi:hypothetical protein
LHAFLDDFILLYLLLATNCRLRAFLNSSPILFLDVSLFLQDTSQDSLVSNHYFTLALPDDHLVLAISFLSFSPSSITFLIMAEKRPNFLLIVADGKNSSGKVMVSLVLTLEQILATPMLGVLAQRSGRQILTALPGRAYNSLTVRY